MRARCLIAGLSVLLFCLLGVQGTCTPIPLPGVVTVYGTVYTKRGEPVPGAVVEVMNRQTGAMLYVHTGGDGGYLLRLSPHSGNYHLRVATWLMGIELQRGEARTNAILSQTSAGEVRKADLYIVGVEYSPLRMTMGVPVEFSVTVFDPNLTAWTSDTRVQMQISISEVFGQEASVDFIRGWLVGGGDFAGIEIVPHAQSLVRMFVDIPLSDREPRVAVVTLMPAHARGRIQVHSRQGTLSDTHGPAPLKRNHLAGRFRLRPVGGSPAC